MTLPNELREMSPSGVLARFRRIYDSNLKGEITLYLHWHEQYEILYIVHGEMSFYIDGERVEAQAGDIVFIPSNCLHVGYNQRDGKFEYVAIIISPEFLGAVNIDPQFDKYIAPILQDRIRLPFLQSTSSLHYPIFSDIVKKAITEYESNAIANELMFKHHLQILFALATRHYFPKHNEANYKHALPVHHIEPLKKLIKYIEMNYAENITIESAAEIVNLSKYYFCKIFKRMTGRTLIDFVNLHRINQATILLKQSDLTIENIAEKVGCCNANYFSKMYFRYKGITPSEARKAEL